MQILIVTFCNRYNDNMAIHKILTCLTLCILSVSAIASHISNPISCPNPYPASKNKLLRVRIFDVVNQKSYELAPARDEQKKGIVKQYWDGFHREPGVKTYFTCSYSGTTKKFTIEVAPGMTICRFTFPYPDTEKSTLLATFYCETRSSDTVKTKVTGSDND